MHKAGLLLLFTHLVILLSAQTTRLVIPNTTVKADTAGVVNLPAVDADAFRESAGGWRNNLHFIYTGGDSSIIVLDINGQQTKMSLKKAVDDTLVKINNIFLGVTVRAFKPAKLVSVTTRQLSVGQQAETTTIPLKVFEFFKRPAYRDSVRNGRLDFMQYLALSKMVMRTVYEQDTMRSLNEFLKLKLDTQENPFWKVEYRAGKFYVHETLDTTDDKTPVSGSLATALSYSTPYFGIEGIHYCITLDSATRKPVVEVDGMYRDTIPLKVHFTTDYNASCIIRRIRMYSGDEDGMVTLNFWRDIDIERFYIEEDPCYVRNPVSWCLMGDVNLPDKSPCPSVKNVKYISRVMVFF